MAEVFAAIPPDNLEDACSAAEAAAEVPAAGNNPVSSPEELLFRHGVLAFMACVAFQVCFHGLCHHVSPPSFHGVCCL